MDAVDPMWASVRRPPRDIEPGDAVTRVMAGIPMAMVVVDVDDTTIYVGEPESGIGMPGGPTGWTFDRATGLEVDPDIPDLTMSYLDFEEAPDGA